MIVLQVLHLLPKSSWTIRGIKSIRQRDEKGTTSLGVVRYNLVADFSKSYLLRF